MGRLKTEAIVLSIKAINNEFMLHDLFTRGIDLLLGKLRPNPEQAPERV